MLDNIYEGLPPVVSMVIQNLAEEAIDSIESAAFDKSILEDIGSCSKPLPLYKLTLCNDILLSDEEWKDWFMPTVERNRRGCQALKDYWKNRWNHPVNEPMDFQNYSEECGHFSGWDMEDLLDGSLKELVERGYDTNEAELCYAVLTYAPDLIQKHIKLGTNPDVCISCDVAPGEGKVGDGETYNALVECQTFVCDAFDIYGLASFWEITKAIPATANDVFRLLEGAAYHKLWKELEALVPKAK